jgi:TRAP-type C4-dicarboxylate transport system substrate-binding protein|tara:strand:+ start:663 stop:1592 length:930 start_codon:yes stop_codon:yes gene_type:complete
MVKQKIKWLLFHEPVELFIRTAKDFQVHLNELTNSKYEIEILTIADYQDKYLDGMICDPFTELKEGRVQVSQIYADSFEHATDFFALSMPYLFESHDHAARVFEGDVGKKLFDHLYERTGVRGLAYTYSGGYRCTASNTPINNVEDFCGKTFQRSTNPILASMIDLMKAKKVSNIGSEKVEADIIQTTYPRYHADASSLQKYVADTRHSMYLTTILLNDDFMSSLSAEDKAHFSEAALRASRKERVQSVADGEKIKNSKETQEELGIQEVIMWSDDEVAKLQTLLSPLYKQYENFFSFDVLNQIKKLKN